MMRSSTTHKGASAEEYNIVYVTIIASFMRSGITDRKRYKKYVSNTYDCTLGY